MYLKKEERVRQESKFADQNPYIDQWDEAFKYFMKEDEGYCRKYHCRCSIGNMPGKSLSQQTRSTHSCIKGLADWAVEASTGCGNWSPLKGD